MFRRHALADQRARGLKVPGQRGLHPFMRFRAGVVEAHAAWSFGCLDKR
jgi:hypothetical protein